MIRWTPRFVYNPGVEVDVTLELPVGIWRHSTPTVGGDIDSDAGHPASFIVRRSYSLIVPVRFFESEWTTVRELIEYGQTGGVITWYPDAEELDSFDVYLEAPMVGDDITGAIDGEYPRALSQAITIRRVDGVAFDGLEYFSESA